MSSEQVSSHDKNYISTKDLLRALLKNNNGKYTEEDVQKKITGCGLALDGKYPLLHIFNKISSTSSSKMSSEDKDCEENWVEALRQLALKLHDDEALQVIAAAKKSMVAAHSPDNLSTERSQPRDINNNLLGASSKGTSLGSDKEEQKRRESELLKIINDLKVQEEPLTPTQSEGSDIGEGNNTS